MNSAEKEAVLHCLKSMIDEEACEECPLYGTTGTDHCEKDCVRLAINALSNAENPNKWIPCSERLPEKNDVYLVAVNSFGCPTRDVDGFMAHTDRKWEVYGNKVIAWMPLPQPYKSEIPTGAEGSEDKE